MKNVKLIRQRRASLKYYVVTLISFIGVVAELKRMEATGVYNYAAPWYLFWFTVMVLSLIVPTVVVDVYNTKVDKHNRRIKRFLRLKKMEEERVDALDELINSSISLEDIGL